MGFNDYMGYQPMYPQRYPRGYEQPAPMGAIPPQQGLIKVTGYEGAKAYQMPPNSVVALFDGNDDVFFVKSTDGAGFPTIRAFSFSPIDAAPAPADFVTRQEFEALKEMIMNGKQPVRKSKADSPAETN